MNWNLPLNVEIDGKSYAIRNKCDYRVILDVIAALNDEEMEMAHRWQCALFIFFENITEIQDVKAAMNAVITIINLGEEPKEDSTPRVMDWEQDFSQIAPPISRVLGYSVRDEKKYTHWYDFIGAYMEIGECTFSTIISIRTKRIKGKKLEKWEEEIYRDNKKLIDLKRKLTQEEEEFLNSDW